MTTKQEKNSKVALICWSELHEKENHEYEKQLQKKNAFDALHSKVQALKDLNLPPEKWNQAQLKIMLRWYKRDGDDKLPTKKVDQLARYYETCNRGDQQAPTLASDPLVQHDTSEPPPLPTNKRSRGQHVDGKDEEEEPVILLGNDDEEEPAILLGYDDEEELAILLGDDDEEELAILLGNNYDVIQHQRNSEQHSDDERELAILLAGGMRQDVADIMAV